jgi:CRP-like cAMP-binding protein
MDFLKILKSISPIVEFTDAESEIFCGAFVEKLLNRDDFFLTEGEICDKIGFVTKGALIYFKSMDNGTEITTDFAFEGDWVTNNLSRLTGKPSLLSIKAIEVSEMAFVTQVVLHDMYTRIPKIERLGRILMEQAYLKMVGQNIDLQILTAKQRYQNLLERYPAVFQKIPQYHIANYLGIAPKSLSRIRREICGR